jgi:hypothetical protein
MSCKKVTDKMYKICAILKRYYEDVLHLALQTLPNSCCSYVLEGPAQVGTEYTDGQQCTYARTREFSLNPNSNTPENDQPQYDRRTVCVIAQQYSSATFV